MLRPELARHVLRFVDGRVSAHRDPTLTRLASEMAGGLFIGGLWLIYLLDAARSPRMKSSLAGLGGKVAAGSLDLCILAGFWAASVRGRGEVRLCSASAL